jgi:hypothetical protein
MIKFIKYIIVAMVNMRALAEAVNAAESVKALDARVNEWF